MEASELDTRKMGIVERAFGVLHRRRKKNITEELREWAAQHYVCEPTQKCAAGLVDLLGPHARDYFEQCPVLPIGLANAQDVLPEREQAAVFRMLERGARLRDIMRALRLPRWTRRIGSPAVRVDFNKTFSWLFAQEPRHVGNFLPGCPSAQVRWIHAVGFFEPLDGLAREKGFGMWAAREFSSDPFDADEYFERLTEIRDYFFRSGEEVNFDWSLKTVREKVRAWHATDTVLSALPDGTELDQVIEQWADRITEPIQLRDLSARLLTTPRELAAEGRAMHHCVADYAPEVLTGYSHIFSIRDPEDKPLITVELGNDGRVKQARGPTNTPPRPREAVNRLAARVCRDLGLTPRRTDDRGWTPERAALIDGLFARLGIPPDTLHRFQIADVNVEAFVQPEFVRPHGMDVRYVQVPTHTSYRMRVLEILPTGLEAEHDLVLAGDLERARPWRAELPDCDNLGDVFKHLGRDAEARHVRIVEHAIRTRPMADYPRGYHGGVVGHDFAGRGEHIAMRRDEAYARALEFGADPRAAAARRPYLDPRRQRD